MSMMYMSPPAGPSLVGGHPQQQVHQTTPSASYQEWLKAWKSWAGTRKRGKMAQFIVQKLEENKQAKWLDITIGKFELTEWHRIAEEWFKEKPRNSDQVDAPCMLRKGLPRAFPGLDEVKGESIKEGTQYRSRVFQAPATLVQEVQLYVSKPSIMYPTSAVGPDMSSYSGHMAAMQMSSAYPQASNGPGYNYVMAGGSMHSPSSIRMKPEPDPLDVGGSPSSSDTASPYTYSNYDGLHNGGGATMVAPPMITDSPVATSDVISVGNGYHSPYNRGQSPYSMESTSPAHTQTTAYHAHQQAQQMLQLQVPTSAGVGEVDGWSNGSSHNSPRYSPDPTYPQDMSQQPLSPPMMVPSQLSPGPNQQVQVLVDVKAYPDQSPLEGGGQLALLFSGQLPPGPKWLSFISQTRPEYVHQVEAIENNAVALTTIIPKHDIPETMNLQVVCGGQVIASTEFTYYANAQYHSDLLFQYLTQTFPTYFPDVGAGGMGGAMGTDGGDGLGGAGGYGGYYGGNIPSTSYSLLLGACRLGIEPLIFATLQLSSMAAINRAQLTKAKVLAEEHGHMNAAKVLGIICELQAISVKGAEGQEPTEQILANEKSKEALQGLDSVKDNLKAAGQKILDHLVKIQKMEQRVKDQEERDSATSSPAHQPSIERSDSSSSETRRRHSANRLQRQDVSVREEDEPPQTTGVVDELSPPVQIHSRASISEQDDLLPPLRPTRSLKSRSGGMGQRKMLVASYSDAADSAVSMSFDHDLEQEMIRRGSASLVSSGLYSLNSSVSQQLLSITIQAQEGETFANGLQYECVYQVMEDFPPNSDSSNVVLKSGDRIIQVGDHLVRDKGPEDFAEILRTEAAHGTTVKILPQLSSSSSGSTSIHSIASSIGYSSLDVAERKQLVRRQSDRELASSLTTKVTNLLTMKASIYPRSVTVPFLAGEGWGFEVTGGNAVGIFISKVSSSRKELQVGDQVLELGGQSTIGMSHYEATSILRSSKDKIQLRVAENIAKFTAIKDQFELESYYIRSHVDHTPSDSKDMPLKKGGIVRVVNTVLFPGYWLAWSVDPNTGMDLDLRRIPSPSAAKQLHGKDVYEAVSAPQPQNIAISVS